MIQLKIRVNYDFTQQELAGEKKEFEVAESTKLGELLRIIDARIVEAGKNKGIDTTYKTTLDKGNLNGCVVFVNGAAPENIMEHELHDGDNIEFVYGFCGG